MVKWIAATAVLMALVGCEQKYRYPCHDPQQWETPRCLKPLCEINRDCPEHILKGANGNNGNNGNGNGITFGSSTGTTGTTPCTQCTNNTNNSFVRSDQKGGNR